MTRRMRLVAVVGLTLALVPEPAHPCTSFVLGHEETLLFGSNYDNDIWRGLLFVNRRGVRKTGWEPSTNGSVASWTARHGSVTFSVAGLQMARAGMNEAGLVMSTMAVSQVDNPPPDERPPLRSPLWMQYMLDTCATVSFERFPCTSEGG